MTGRKIWGALLLTGAAIEVYGISHPEQNDTLSEFVRWAFQTHTPLGRAALIVACGSGATWFTYHILDGSRKR